MDKITIDRIGTLHPKIRKQVLDAYTHVNNRLLGKGVRLRFAHTTRTIEEQNELFAQGRTKLFDKKGRRLGVVTKARGGQSIHNYHLAFDIVAPGSTWIVFNTNLGGATLILGANYTTDSYSVPFTAPAITTGGLQIYPSNDGAFTIDNIEITKD